MYFRNKLLVVTLALCAGVANAQSLEDILAGKKKAAEKPEAPVIVQPALSTGPTYSTVRIRAVYGEPGEMSADIIDQGDQLTVSEGDEIADGGKVTHITKQGITVSYRDGKSRTIRFSLGGFDDRSAVTGVPTRSSMALPPVGMPTR